MHLAARAAVTLVTIPVQMHDLTAALPGLWRYESEAMRQPA